MNAGKTDYEVMVIGAGVAGIYQMKRLVDLNIPSLLLEAYDDLGGTWYRNRYPGARFDSESYTYGYSFSKEVLDEWHWKERFSSQPENLRYLNFVAEKFDLRRHMRFNSRVAAMVWSEDQRLWTLTLTTGEVFTTRFVITCVGVISTPTLPKIEGMSSFRGESFHTYWWPQEPVTLAGKRVGIIGTGATGIQVIAEIADEVGELTVFQRRPNWSVPLNNAPISDEEMASIRARYDEIFATCDASQGGFDHLPDRRGYYNVTEQERYELWDELYEKRTGFALQLANFPETFFDSEANRALSEYVADRIRQRVKNPATAEKLIPRDHGFGMQRLPLETHYFEAYNRDNVRLVDISENSILRISETGIETADGNHALDLIIYATGFHVMTGAFDGIHIEGVDGKTLKEKFESGPGTYNGLLSHGFPNMIMVAGPQSVSGSTNYPRAIEVGVDWATDLLIHARSKNMTRIEPQLNAEYEWQQEVKSAHERMPFRRGKSWFTGYNSNVEGHEEGNIHYHAYWGGAPRYRSVLQQTIDEGYKQIDME